jgi:hypothetical protein
LEIRSPGSFTRKRGGHSGTDLVNTLIADQVDVCPSFFVGLIEKPGRILDFREVRLFQISEVFIQIRDRCIRADKYTCDRTCRSHSSAKNIDIGSRLLPNLFANPFLMRFGIIFVVVLAGIALTLCNPENVISLANILTPSLKNGLSISGISGSFRNEYYLVLTIIGIEKVHRLNLGHFSR